MKIKIHIVELILAIGMLTAWTLHAMLLLAIVIIAIINANTIRIEWVIGVVALMKINIHSALHYHSDEISFLISLKFFKNQIIIY